MKRTPDQILIRKHERRIAKLESQCELLTTKSDSMASALSQIGREVSKARSVVQLTDPEHQKLLTSIERVANIAATAVAGKRRVRKRGKR